ncbi:MAG TPA: DnaJ domain-containing protein [Chloroflexota bacterium]|jgi:DnaJ-class molecular chaperone|nr:DnaJ domain-containing protein [Chloroflexota bacterium]
MSQFPYSQYVQAAKAYGATAQFAPSTFAATPEVANAYAVLWLRPGAPLSVVQAAYRALASRYHPDAGGDALAMRRLNQAYETLCAQLAT